MIGVEALVHLIIWILVIGAIFWLLTIIIAKIDPPQPFRKFAEIVLYVVGCLILISILLSFLGHPIIRWS